MRSTAIRGTVLTVVLGLSPVIVPVPSASAQAVFTSSVRVGGGEGAAQQISARSLEKYKGLLGLDDSQSEVVDTLYQGYASGVQLAREGMSAEMREIEREARETEDFRLLARRMPAIARAFAERSRELESGFFEDVRSVLTLEQEEHMAEVERLRRREVRLPGMFVSGASVDLTDVVSSLELSRDAQSSLGPVLLEYEMAIDRELVDAERESERNSPMDGESLDMEKMQEFMRAVRERAIRVRDLNRRHARAIEAELSPELQARFGEAVQHRSFPQVYRKAYVSEAIESAMGFSDLSAEQAEQLRALRENYLREVESANKDWAGEIAKADESSEGGVFQLHMMMGGGEDDSPLARARRARRDVDKRYEERVQRALNEDQVARLPERRDRDPGMGQFVVGGEGGGGAMILHIETETEDE